MSGVALTQVVNQRVELWVNGVKKSSHLSEGEAMSQGSIALAKDPSALIDLIFVGRKRLTLTTPPAVVDVTQGSTVALGFVSSDPAVAVVTGQCDVSLVGVGPVTISAVVK